MSDDALKRFYGDAYTPPATEGEAARIRRVAKIIADIAEPDGLGAWEGYADAARKIIAAVTNPATGEVPK